MDTEGQKELLGVIWGTRSPEAVSLPGARVLTIPEPGEDAQNVEISVRREDREALYEALLKAGMQEDPRVDRPDRSLPWLRVVGSGEPDLSGFDVVQFRDLNADRVPA